MKIYEERQMQKQATIDYKDKAARVCHDCSYEGFEFSLPQHGAIKLMDDGAFVEVVLWVPKERLKL